MEKNSRKYVLIILLGAGAFMNITCRDANTRAETSKSFTGKNWKLVKLTAAPAIDWDLDGNPDTDILSLVEACEKDDLMHFKADHSVISYPGKIKCDEADMESVTGSWKYDTDQQALTVTEQDAVTTYKLLDITPDALTLLYSFKKTNGQSHQMTAVYEATP